MLRAVLDGVVLAEAPRTVRVEGNHYFPPASVNERYLHKSRLKTLCPWKGIATYYSVGPGEQPASNGAWSYLYPLPFARRIKGHVAFDAFVTIEGEPEARPDEQRGFRAALLRLLRPTQAS